MLSFDITDRHIRIVKGEEKRGRVKIVSATTISLKEGVIINGHIKDIPQMATIINDEIKAKKMQDKEAIISISSNLVIFKELHIPKAKGQQQLLTMVQNQMQHTMGIGDDYSISYTIAGEIEEDGSKVMKILATACPFEVVKAFKKVFSMLSINLRSVAVACNTISRLVYADKRLSMKMPLLLVQIDQNFVSLNLYENNQLVFSRFTSIDAADYDEPDDYIYQAVNENIFRMFQFQRSQNPDDPVQNVVFYGETTEYIRLTHALEQMDIQTSLLGVPPTVTGYENYEFQEYANAIGAMFRSNKEYERINLLEVDAAAGKTSAGTAFALALLAAAGISAAIVGAFCLFFSIQTGQYNAAREDIRTWIDSAETQTGLIKVDEAQARLDKLRAYSGKIKLAYDNYKTIPMFSTEIYDLVQSYTEGTSVTSGEFSFNSGVISLTLTAETIDGPSQFIQNAVEDGYFRNISYNGYSYSESVELVGEIEVPTSGYEFTTTFYMPPIQPTVEETEETIEVNEEVTA
ncbi:MAG: pilus assembly protein PilM [Ruminococcus sp.]|jgi:type IV pilus assembly protein PilM|nr:pilus assembly protein PilM [Ruminococcus sp.]